MKQTLIRIFIGSILLSALFWPIAAKAQELPCGAVLVGMSGQPLDRIDKSRVSKGSLSKFKQCPRDKAQCERSCFKWTPTNKDEPSFCFATVQHFVYDESMPLKKHTAFKYRYDFGYVPSMTDDFFWLESNQASSQERYNNQHSEVIIWGINRIGETGREFPGFLNCERLGELMPPSDQSDVSTKDITFPSGSRKQP